MFENITTFVFAAGKGTRLRPITNTVPKPLVEIQHKPLLTYNLEWLRELTDQQIIVNAQYLGDELIKYADDHPNFNIEISLEPEELGHAGGLKYAQSRIDNEYLFAVNGDTIIKIPEMQIKEGINAVDTNADLVIFCYDSGRNPLGINQNNLVSIGKKQLVDQPAYSFLDAFGAYFIKKSILELIDIEEGFMGFYGNDDLIERALATNKVIETIELKDYERLEITNPQDLDNANKNFNELTWLT